MIPVTILIADGNRFRFLLSISTQNAGIKESRAAKIWEFSRRAPRFGPRNRGRIGPKKIHAYRKEILSCTLPERWQRAGTIDLSRGTAPGGAWRAPAPPSRRPPRGPPRAPGRRPCRGRPAGGWPGGGWRPSAPPP